ncbi:MAG: adenylyltransferase/cytidyltransferase family protein [Balneolaceae bacterium]
MIIGFTVGTFDLFHIGHLRLLETARSMCDRLIVGVNTEQILGYKDHKCVIPYDQRAEIIKSLRCVDAVVPLYYRDPVLDCERIKYNILFIGSDWYNTDLWKSYEDRLPFGVKIVYLPYTQGISTSNIRERIVGDTQ